MFIRISEEASTGGNASARIQTCRKLRAEFHVERPAIIANLANVGLNFF
jgi:hypothetical protein